MDSLVGTDQSQEGSLTQEEGLKPIVPTYTTLLLGSRATTLPQEWTLAQRGPGSLSHTMDQIGKEASRVELL